MVKRVIVGMAIVFLAYQSSCEWTDWYASIANSRFESWMGEGEWRSPAAQWNNAVLGVRMEWALGLLAIWASGAASFAYAHQKFGK